MKPTFSQQFLDHALNEVFRLFQTPSISVSVWDGNLEYHSAVGMSDLECQVPASCDSIYCVGSSSKAFTATAICMLVNDGLLELDQPVRKYLPEFRAYDPYVTENLTVRDILCHRCGLPRHDTTLFSRVDGSIWDIVEAIQYLKPAFPLRYKWSYQNHMFTLAGALVEKVSGTLWEDFVRERIMKPLGMNASYPTGEKVPEELEQKARPYDNVADGFKRIPYNYIANYAPAGAIFSTTKDMLKWLKFNIVGDENLLPEELRKELHTPQMLIKPGEFPYCDYPEINSTAYGLGWFVYGYRGSVAVHHGGTIDGFRSQQIFMPGEKLAVSVLTNSNCPFPIYALAYTLLDAMLGVDESDWNMRWLENEKNTKATYAAARDRFALLACGNSACVKAEEYIGVYTEKAYGKLTVFHDGERLMLRLGENEYPLNWVEKDQFSLPMDMWLECFPVRFVRGKDGIVTTMEIPLEPLLGDEPIVFQRESTVSDF